MIRSQNVNIPSVGGYITMVVAMWTFDVDYVTQNKMSAFLRTLVSNACFLLLLRDVRQTST